MNLQRPPGALAFADGRCSDEARHSGRSRWPYGALLADEFDLRLSRSARLSQLDDACHALRVMDAGREALHGGGFALRVAYPCEAEPGKADSQHRAGNEKSILDEVDLQHFDLERSTRRRPV